MCYSVLHILFFPTRSNVDRVVHWNKLSQSTQELIKTQLIAAAMVETSKLVIRTIVDLVGDVAEILLEDGKWNNLLPSMFSLTQDKNVCFIIFYF